jgi:hypothetical protein
MAGSKSHETVQHPGVVGLIKARFFDLKSAAPAMIVCSASIMVAILINKIVAHYPLLEYAQLLATYRFGIIRRALIGQLWSLLHDRVAAADVYILGANFILITMGLFFFVFVRVVGPMRDNMPLFACMFGSPFFFKNFIFSIGYFDVLGCLTALLALALPLNPVFIPLIGTACILLLFVHHLHFLLYIPTIALIVVLRHRAGRRWGAFALGQMGLFAVAIGSAFLFLAFFARLSISPDVFYQYLVGRAVDPLERDVLWLWYSTITDEMSVTMRTIPKNLILRSPIYAVLLALHAPLIGYLRRMLLALENRFDLTLVLGGLGIITAGYIVICVVVFDYGRWISNWAVCMMLIMLCIHYFPSPRISGKSCLLTRRNAILAWITTAIPRVGITKPF